jgi:serine/threonine protein kinase
MVGARASGYAGRVEKLREVTVTDMGRLLCCLDPGDELHAGTVLGGRYRIRQFLAAGGMGEVYEADDQLLGDPVAVKLLRADMIRKPGAQARFADEIRLARKITHPNVYRVFDAGLDNERVFYTMELYAGTTLKQHLHDHPPLTIGQLAPIASQILAGLGAAHAADVVHADLKPSNVLMLPNGRVVVTDFGLALPCCATLGCQCDMPHLIGTPAYMAPEQVTGGMVLDGTDLFAFGVIAYEALTGELPWDGDTAMEMARARLEGETPSPRKLVPELDARWDDVIRACLQVERKARPASAADVARVLGL